MILLFPLRFFFFFFKIVASGRLIERETKDCKMKKRKKERKRRKKMKKVRTIVSPGFRLKKEEKKRSESLRGGGWREERDGWILKYGCEVRG